jgi:hypothetical protein
MHRLILSKSAIALIACFVTSLVAAATPVRAVKAVPDAGILSARPFQFRSDNAIFSTLPDTPGDSRIFSPLHSVPDAYAMQPAQKHFVRSVML